MAALPADDTDLETVFTCLEYPMVALDDNIYVDQSATGEYAAFQWKDKNDNDTEPIEVEWIGKTNRAPSDSTVYLQIYNRNGFTWETLDSDNTTAADTEFTLSGTQSASLGDYYDGSYWVACRVYQRAI